MTREELNVACNRATKFINKNNDNVKLKNFLKKFLSPSYPIFSHFFVWMECMELIRDQFPSEKSGTLPNDLAFYIEAKRGYNE